jgi:thioredoxin-like negative regulator of GroEL
MNAARLFVALPMLLLAASLAFGSDVESPIAWETSYAATIKTAKAGGKPILFKFYTGWCPHCVRMNKTTWMNEDIAKLSESFVAGKINADVDKVPVKRYRLSGYPTVIVAEPGGEQVLRLEGYKSAKVVAGYLKTYLKKQDEIHGAFATLRESKNDATAQLELGDFYRSVGLGKFAVKRYESVLKNGSGEQVASAAAGAGHCLAKKEEFKQALKMLEKGMSAAGDRPSADFMLAMARTHAGLGQASEAKSWFDRIVKEHGTSPEAKKARTELAAL